MGECILCWCGCCRVCFLSLCRRGLGGKRAHDFLRVLHTEARFHKVLCCGQLQILSRDRSVSALSQLSPQRRMHTTMTCLSGDRVVFVTITVTTNSCTKETLCFSWCWLCARLSRLGVWEGCRRGVGGVWEGCRRGTHLTGMRTSGARCALGALEPGISKNRLWLGSGDELKERNRRGSWG